VVVITTCIVQAVVDVVPSPAVAQAIRLPRLLPLRIGVRVHCVLPKYNTSLDPVHPWKEKSGEMQRYVPQVKLKLKTHL